MSEALEVEVVYALADRQHVLSLSLPEGANVADALREASRREAFAELDLAAMAVGVWGVRVLDRARRLCTGDRVEIYRPLRIDPVTARRRAAAGISPSNRR